MLDEIERLDEFFENPRAFVTRFVEVLYRRHLEPEGKAIAENGLFPLFNGYLVEEMDRRLAMVKPEPDEHLGIKPSIATCFVLHGVMGTLPYFAEIWRK